MLVWYQPMPNEVNFLPWLVQRIAHKRRKKLWLYAVMVGFISLNMAWFGVLYTDLLQAQTQLQQQLKQGSTHLQKQQQIAWAGSQEERQKKWHQTMDEQRHLNAWVPAMQLSKLLMQLHKPTLAHTRAGTQLLNWQWQPINDGRLGAYSVVFTITGQEPWQAWWQQALTVWPSIRMEALEPVNDGWLLKAGYIIQAQPKPEPKSQIQSSLAPSIIPPAVPSDFALQLTPPDIADAANSKNTTIKGEPFADLARQLEKYGQALNITRSQGVQTSVVLPSAAWVLLAPLPSAQGFWLQSLSIDQAPVAKWKVAMHWIPNNDAPALMFAFSERGQSSQHIKNSTHERIHAYAQREHAATLQAQIPLPQSASPQTTLMPVLNNQKDSITKQLEFIGYSAQQESVSVVWLRSRNNGHLIQAKVGSVIDGWRVSNIHPKGVSLTLGQQQMTLVPTCFTGVCE
ncbi:MAG: hypothetical protein KC426_09390 [Oceanospirillaceae bacterium]|nr:hypothetical protein [Oceanospirillaceae bacterium]